MNNKISALISNQIIFVLKNQIFIYRGKNTYINSTTNVNSSTSSENWIPIHKYNIFHWHIQNYCIRKINILPDGKLNCRINAKAHAHTHILTKSINSARIKNDKIQIF